MSGLASIRQHFGRWRTGSPRGKANSTNLIDRGPLPLPMPLTRRHNRPDAQKHEKRRAIDEPDPETACPVLDAGWKPVFRKDHAQTKNEIMIRFNPRDHELTGGKHG